MLRGIGFSDRGRDLIGRCPRSCRSATLVRMRPNQLAASALFLAAVSQFAPAQAQTSVVARLAAQNGPFDESWQATLKTNPTLATAVGDYRYNDQLGDSSLAASASRHERELAELTRIKAIDSTGFPEPDLISHSNQALHSVKCKETTQWNPHSV